LRDCRQSFRFQQNPIQCRRSAKNFTQTLLAHILGAEANRQRVPSARASLFTIPEHIRKKKDLSVMYLTDSASQLAHNR
jgi:hypothetical protein